MRFLWHQTRAEIAHESTHLGSVWRLSAASPQVLLLLKGSLTYHGAWRLRLVEGWLIFFSFPSAARGYLLPPPSFSPSPLAACGWDAVDLKSVCLLSRARHWRRNPACTTHVVSPFSKGVRPTSARCHWSRAPWHLLAVEVSWFMTSISSRLFRVACARLRLLTLAAVAASAVQVPRGQGAPLDEFRTLLIDWSAESVESSLPVRGGTWHRTREHQSSVHSSDSSRDASHLALHVEAVMPSWHLRRQLALLTHLEHPVEDHCDRCRSSFFFDSSRRL